ncbi:MAG: hypothetical protein ACKO5A_00105 [Actinomycetota bacterium]
MVPLSGPGTFTTEVEMGFLDKAKAAADQAMAKADSALSGSGVTGGSKPVDGYLKDLGLLAYLEATSRPPADIAERRAQLIGWIYEIESAGPINLNQSSTAPGSAPAAPPPPGAAAAAAAPPPPGAAAAAAPPPYAPAAPPPSAPAAPPPPGAVAPPPPPGSVPPAGA